MPAFRVEHDPESYFPFEFEAVVERHDIGRYAYTVVYLPLALCEHLPLAEHPRLRVSGEIGEHPFDGAWQPSKGRWYLMLSKKLLKDGDFTVGDTVTVRFRRESQDAVDVPVVLDRLLNSELQLRTAWDALTAGAQRGLCHHVSAAKTLVTTAKRLDEVREALKTGTSIRDIAAARRRRLGRNATR